MPSLPRIRRSTGPRHAADVVARAPQVAELAGGGLTWVNAVGPDLETAQALAERFGWHPLDVEDVVSKRQRPKVDDYEDLKDDMEEKIRNYRELKARCD